MQRRIHTIAQFSMFIHWENNRFRRWIAHPRLQDSMRQQLEQNASLSSAQYWLIFWHQRSLEEENKKLAQEHLYAYLQEPCYQVACLIWRDYQQRFDYSIEDYFHVGVLKFDKILQKFNPTFDKEFRDYAFTVLKWRIIDELRQFNKAFGHTIWSLLLNSSELQLKKALLRSGIIEKSLDQYFHAWDCYKQIYTKAKIFNKDGKLQEPSPEQWLEMTDLSNQVDIEMAEPLRHLLMTAGEALVQYLSPLSVSLNQSFDGNSELGDFIADEQAPDSLEEVEDREEADEQFQRIYTWLQRQLNQLDVQQYRMNPQIVRIIELRYGQSFTQTDIAKQLGINQATVARNITKFQEVLAKLFIEWSADNLDSPLQSTDIQSIGGAIQLWIQYHYQKENPSAQEPKI